MQRVTFDDEESNELLLNTDMAIKMYYSDKMKLTKIVDDLENNLNFMESEHKQDFAFNDTT